MTVDDLKARAARRAPTIIAVCDNSGSMGPYARMLVACVEALVQQVPCGTTLGVVAFDTTARAVIPPTKLDTAADGAALMARLRPHLTVNGSSTDIHAAVMAALDMAAASAARDVTVVLLTDGEANAGVTSAPAILEATRAHSAFPNVSLHCIGFAPLHAAVGAELLCRLSLARNGAFNRVSCVEDVGAAFGDCLGAVLTTLAVRVSVEVEAVALVPAVGPVPAMALVPAPPTCAWLSPQTSDIVLKHQEPRTLVARMAGVHERVRVRVVWTDPITDECHGQEVEVLTADATRGEGPATARAQEFRERGVAALHTLNAARAAYASATSARSTVGYYPTPRTALHLQRSPAVAFGGPASRADTVFAPPATEFDKDAGRILSTAAVDVDAERRERETREREALERHTAEVERANAGIAAARTAVDAVRTELQHLVDEATAAIVFGGSQVLLYTELRDNLRDMLGRGETVEAVNSAAAMMYQMHAQRNAVGAGGAGAGGDPSRTLSTVSDVTAGLRSATGAQVRTASSMHATVRAPAPAPAPVPMPDPSASRAGSDPHDPLFMPPSA